MKKILIAFDGNHFSEGTLDFARELNRRSPVLLTGAFVPQTSLANLWSFSGGGLAGPTFIPLVEQEDAELVQKNVRQFESFCKKNEIRYTVHKDYFDFAIPELKKETRFADLLVVSSNVFYREAGTDSPNEYLVELLHGAECPVVIVPETFRFPGSTILSYDGSESSVFAIKQFSYLFPYMASLPAMVVYTAKKPDADIPEESHIRELVSRQFYDLSWQVLEGNPKEIFSSWLAQHKSSILVSGAFGRSGFSMLFKKSFVTEAIGQHKIPLFIAHK